ncbi:hypothetical protein B0H19DRAFT_1370825, partial [Mycena capillaripes]
MRFPLLASTRSFLFNTNQRQTKTPLLLITSVTLSHAGSVDDDEQRASARATMAAITSRFHTQILPSESIRERIFTALDASFGGLTCILDEELNISDDVLLAFHAAWRGRRGSPSPTVGCIRGDFVPGPRSHQLQRTS